MNLADGCIGPALDTRKQPLDAGAVAVDDIAGRGGIVLESRAVWVEHWHQVFCAGEDVDVRLFSIPVLRQPLVGLARDRRQRQAPAQTKGAVAGTGIVGERKLRAEAGATGAGRDRHRHGTGAGDRVGGELLAHTPDGAAAFREGNRRSGEKKRFFLGCLSGRRTRPTGTQRRLLLNLPPF